MLVHSYLPQNFILSILTPVIKNKQASPSNSSNYRPIAIASICSKVFESILLLRSSNMLSSSVFICYMDASKAFDRVNYNKLVDMLHKRKVPTYLKQILYYWYNNQEIKIKWYKTILEPFKVTNGVRRRGGGGGGYYLLFYSTVM